MVNDNHVDGDEEEDADSGDGDGSDYDNNHNGDTNGKWQDGGDMAVMLDLPAIP